MRKFLINGDIPRDSWSSFVAGHPKGTVFQTPEMYEVYEKTSNITPIAVALVQDNEIKGVLLAAIMTNGGPFFKMLTARSIITGGPLTEKEDAELTSELLRVYSKSLPKYVIYSEIRPVFDPDTVAEIYSNQLFRRYGHYNMMIDVSSEESQLWLKLHRLRRRNVIKAQNAGVEFKEVSSEEEIRKAKELIISTYHRKRVPMTYVDALDKVKPILGNRIRFFAAFHEDKMIACLVGLCYKELLFLWFNGSDKTFLKELYSNDYLTWMVLCLAHDEGYITCDFGGGGEPGVPYGVRDYKLKFGCELHEYGRFICVHHPLLYNAGKTVVNLVKKE